MLKYPCLVLDHDDTVVQSEATVNYPCFCRFLEQYRPGITMSLAEYVEACSNMSFVDMCKSRFALTDEEMHQEYVYWQEYMASHIPAVYPGIDHLLREYRKAGGKICVVSMSSQEIILRDYLHHFGFEPHQIYGCDLPKEQQKPNTWAMEQIQKEYGFSAGEMLILDDMKFAVSMARAAGSPIAFTGWGRKDFPVLCEEMEKLCDFSFYNIREFEEFLLD